MPAIHKRYEYETGGHNTGTIVAGVVLSALVLGCFILTIRSHVAKRRAACNIQDPPAVNLESLPMRRLSIESHGTGQGSQDPMKKKANFEDEFTEPAPPPYILPQDVKNPFIPLSGTRSSGTAASPPDYRASSVIQPVDYNNTTLIPYDSLPSPLPVAHVKDKNSHFVSGASP